MVSSPPMTVKRWASAEHPFIFEINTWPWLAGLSADGRPVGSTSGTVPDARWDVIAESGFDAVWLMGVWERSPAGRRRRPGRRGAVRELPKPLSRLPPGGRGRLALLRPRLRRRPAPRRPGRSRRRSRRARPSRARPRARLRPQPRRARPPVDRRPPRALRPGHRADLAADPRSFIEVAGRVLRAWVGSVLPRRGPTSCSSTRSPPRCARAVVETLARDRRAVRRCPLRHGDAR